MLSRSLTRLTSSLLLGAVAASLTAQAFAATGDTATSPSSVDASLSIEQVNAQDEKLLGTWTLLQPGNKSLVSIEAEKSLTGLAWGNYTIFAEPPKGATATIRVYNQGEEILNVNRPQANFALTAGSNYRIIINYLFTRVGDISVNSDPSGIPFRMDGPNDQVYKGTTPMSYSNMAEGQYKVQYEQLEGCAQVPPKSLLLEKDKRIAFDITIVCEEAEKMRQEQKERATGGGKFIPVPGTDLTFRDVPQEAWFAEAVFAMARTGVLSGYKNKQGELTGAFGPENTVTVAELAKIAHRIAGIDEESIQTPPLNALAQNQWFSTFFASSEQHGWTIYASGNVDPSRNATRGEVLVTLLQALDIPLQWQKGNTFTDVTPRTPYAAAIETAAEAKIIEGRDDGSFGPMDPVNRAEIAKILFTLSKAHRNAGSSSSAR